MAAWSRLFLGTLSTVLFVSACASDETGDGSGGSASESSCETLCRRAGEADCKPDDCVGTCENGLPKCNGEYSVLVDCMAGAEMLGCDPNTHQPSAGDACQAESSAFGTCLVSGTGGSGGTGSGVGGGGGSGNTGPCDPLKASCVACGAASCDAPETCCWGDPAPACGAKGGCAAKIESACDGAEDCAGGSCCVSFQTTMDGTASSGQSECSAAGGSVCCSATPGTPGCGGDKTVEMCVCAQDDFCCTMEWDAMCVGEVEQFGCASCGAGCDLTNGSTGQGSSIHSVSCRTGADCAGVAGEFGVPYSECCRAKNYGVGACVSQTFAGVIADSGGSCL